MKTEIYKNEESFNRRKNKTTNGVSPSFAEHYPNYKKDNETNQGCWNCDGCEGCLRCSDCSDCSGCRKCDYCYNCRECYDCQYCHNCYDCYDNEPLQIPIIKNIHQKIYKAVKQPGALNMEDWHTCSTTHCRAGWVIILGGEEAQELEKKEDTSFAALAIYNKSSPIKVSINEFHKSNEEALVDMKRCAELEQQL